MAYNDFKLGEVIQTFGLTIHEVSGLFANIPEEDCDGLLETILKDNVDLTVAINTEKARSEMIVSPVLLAVRRKFNGEIGLFSGFQFDVDSARGLNGLCNFMLSRSKEQLFLRAPVVTVVETKNENLTSGLAQCLAEMLAVQLFNEQQGNDIKTVYGVTTIGTIWQFMKLEADQVYIDLSQYYIRDIRKILGILSMAIREN